MDDDPSGYDAIKLRRNNSNVIRVVINHLICMFNTARTRTPIVSLSNLS